MWHQVSSGTTATWHDHRVHYMGTSDPPVVQRDPSVRHVVDQWTVKLRVDGRTVRATGVLLWLPPPSPWPYVVIALVVAIGVFVLTRTKVWRTAFAAGLALLALSDLTHVAGLWNATTASTASQLGESAYSLVGIALSVFALVWMWRRGADSAMPLILIAAIFLFVAGGLADVVDAGPLADPDDASLRVRPAPDHARPGPRRRSGRGRRVASAPATPCSAAPDAASAEGSGGVGSHQLSSSHPSWSSGSTWMVACAISWATRSDCA